MLHHINYDFTDLVAVFCCLQGLFAVTLALCILVGLWCLHLLAGGHKKRDNSIASNNSKAQSVHGAGEKNSVYVSAGAAQVRTPAYLRLYFCCVAVWCLTSTM